MTSNETATKSSGAGFPLAGITALTFTILKLTHVIDWSWWWILSPLWIVAIIIILVIIIAIIVAIIKSND